MHRTSYKINITYTKNTWWNKSNESIEGLFPFLIVITFSIWDEFGDRESLWYCPTLSQIQCQKLISILKVSIFSSYCAPQNLLHVIHFLSYSLTSYWDVTCAFLDWIKNAGKIAQEGIWWTHLQFAMKKGRNLVTRAPTTPFFCTNW